MRTKVEVLVAVWLLYIRSFTDTSSRRTRRVSIDWDKAKVVDWDAQRQTR